MIFLKIISIKNIFSIKNILRRNNGRNKKEKEKVHYTRFKKSSDWAPDLARWRWPTSPLLPREWFATHERSWVWLWTNLNIFSNDTTVSCRIATLARKLPVRKLYVAVAFFL